MEGGGNAGHSAWRDGALHRPRRVVAQRIGKLFTQARWFPATDAAAGAGNVAARCPSHSVLGLRELIAKAAATSFTLRVLFDFLLKKAKPDLTQHFLVLDQIPIRLIRHPRARRYVLRLQPDGQARVTIPRGGSVIEARRFAERNQAWLVEQLQRRAAQPVQSPAWQIGAEILFRGELVQLELKPEGRIHFGSESVQVTEPAADLRPAIEKHLRKLAAKELPPRMFELSVQHRLTIRRVTIRSQKSRWGSCSRSGTISLNWKLIQMPPFVRDYILLHELMHLREMNHSARFWREVAAVCPDFLTAKQWLKQHSARLK